MKYLLNNYVQALTQALEQNPHDKENIISNFVKLLKKTRDIRSSAKIIEAVNKKLVNDKGGNWVNIEAARKLSESNQKSLKNKFSEKDNINFNVNSELVAGVRLTINGEEELDNSLNNKLKKLFK